MSDNQERFKGYLRKIGSGEHTSRSMSRQESADALELILKQKVSPAQIGAFMIAHRIRRPEPQELAGMLDTYLKLGPTLKSLQGNRAPICFGMPFDGRTRISPIYPLTALVLLSANQPVILQGGQSMPIKYGITTIELFKALGLNLKGLSLNEVQNGFNQHGLALIHQPDHFSLADNLIQTRDEIAKRPPIASMELLWTVHKGKHLIISGFVHPPTEERFWKTLAILGEEDFISIKGLEGGIDLPISRPCITGRLQNKTLQRLILQPREFQSSGPEIKWSNIEIWQDQAYQALNNSGPLLQILRWNAGVYLWFSGITSEIEEGLTMASSLIESGSVNNTLLNLINWRKTKMDKS